MITGVGTDLLSVHRMQKSLENPAFYQRVFTAAERVYIEHVKNPLQRAERAAGIFCAKEACAKALGTGFAGIRPDEIEIRHTDSGQPYPTFLKHIAPARTFSLSISHSETHAVAFAVAEQKEEDVK